MGKKVFNMTLEQFNKMAGKNDNICDHNRPIRKEETLEPCLRGAQKILDDPSQKEMMYRIYTGVRNKNESVE